MCETFSWFFYHGPRRCLASQGPVGTTLLLCCFSADRASFGQLIERRLKTGVTGKWRSRQKATVLNSHVSLIAPAWPLLKLAKCPGTPCVYLRRHGLVQCPLFQWLASEPTSHLGNNARFTGAESPFSGLKGLPPPGFPPQPLRGGGPGPRGCLPARGRQRVSPKNPGAGTEPRSPRGCSEAPASGFPGPPGGPRSGRQRWRVFTGT